MLGSAPSRASWCGWLRPFGTSKGTSRTNSRQNSLKSEFPARLMDNLRPKHDNRSEFPAGHALRSEFLGVVYGPKSMTSGVSARQCTLQGFWVGCDPAAKA